MFPPMSPQTERVRHELENQEIERHAAFNARLGESQNRSLVQFISRLLNRKPNSEPVERHTRPSAPCTEPTAEASL